MADQLAFTTASTQERAIFWFCVALPHATSESVELHTHTKSIRHLHEKHFVFTSTNSETSDTFNNTIKQLDCAKDKDGILIHRHG